MMMWCDDGWHVALGTAAPLARMKGQGWCARAQWQDRNLPGVWRELWWSLPAAAAAAAAARAWLWVPVGFGSSTWVGGPCRRVYMEDGGTHGTAWTLVGACLVGIGMV